MIFLMDVFGAEDEVLEHLLTATPIQSEGFQSMVLINGYGGGITVTGEKCNETLPVINVEAGKTYRMRVVGGTGISYDIFAIEGHPELDIIEADA
jgi:L-ascorbate oxidase